MNSPSVKRKAAAYLKQFGLREITLDSLSAVLRKQGYLIIEFHPIENDKNVSALISALNLEQICQRSKGFTYADSQRRLVFLHEGLSDDEKLMVLSHEQGHIYCRHLASSPILGQDVIEEHEASEFAHYLLHKSPWRQLRSFLKKHRKGVIGAAAALVLCIAGSLVGGKMYRENTYYGEYYITPTGNKYHNKDCGYVKGKANIQRLTIRQHESGAYTPCDKCVGE